MANTPRDSPIAVGVVHRTLERIELVVRDYDEMRARSLTLEVGALFQPWQPLDHWRGEHVPITLGTGAHEFDWGVTALLGHFMEWDDFFERTTRA